MGSPAPQPSSAVQSRACVSAVSPRHAPVGVARACRHTHACTLTHAPRRHGRLLAGLVFCSDDSSTPVGVVGPIFVEPPFSVSSLSAPRSTERTAQNGTGLAVRHSAHESYAVVGSSGPRRVVVIKRTRACARPDPVQISAHKIKSPRAASTETGAAASYSATPSIAASSTYLIVPHGHNSADPCGSIGGT
jgi:hypothetical protein